MNTIKLLMAGMLLPINLSAQILKDMKRYLTIILASVVFVGCNSSNIDMVKKSTMKDYSDVYVGKMLDNYKYFTSTEWSEFTTSQGKEIVEFIGRYEKRNDSTESDQSDIQESFAEIFAGAMFGEAIGFVKIQFAIYKEEQDDGTAFEISYIGTKKDEAETFNTLFTERLVDRIYHNKPLFAL